MVILVKSSGNVSKNRTAYQGLREIGTKIYYFSKLFANENPMLSVFSCINIISPKSLPRPHNMYKNV